MRIKFHKLYYMKYFLIYKSFQKIGLMIDKYHTSNWKKVSESSINHINESWFENSLIADKVLKRNTRFPAHRRSQALKHATQPPDLVTTHNTVRSKSSSLSLSEKITKLDDRWAKVALCHCNSYPHRSNNIISRRGQV